jgi:hypothetical protein
MTYAELLPALIEKKLVHTKAPPPVPVTLPWRYKTERTCAFHQGAPGHDIEHWFVLKAKVQRLIRNNILSFKDLNPNVQANPLPNHGTVSVNMVLGCSGKFHVFDIGEPLVQMHINPRGCQRVRYDIQGMLDRRELRITYKRNEDEDDEVFVIVHEFNIPEPVEVTFNSQQSAVTPLVICLSGPMPYTSDKAVPYKYNATMIED